MIMPPIDVPWPPMNLVSDCTTMSAPNSMGRHRMGVATVLSTMSGTPTSCAASAHARRSTTLRLGLPSDSTNTARVFSSARRAIDDGSLPSAKRTSMPNCGSVCANRL